MLVGQRLALAQLERLDTRLLKRAKIKMLDLVNCYRGLLILGRSDFDAIDAFRQDPCFWETWEVGQMPGSVWLRQQLEVHAATVRDQTDDWNMRLIRRSGALIKAEDGFVCLDFDTFVIDNSGAKKECAGRMYQGVDGYTRIAVYLGNENHVTGRFAPENSCSQVLSTSLEPLPPCFAPSSGSQILISRLSRLHSASEHRRRALQAIQNRLESVSPEWRRELEITPDTGRGFRILIRTLLILGRKPSASL